MRTLTNLEYKAVLALAEQVGSDELRAQLLLDIRDCVVDDRMLDGSRFVFHITGYERPPYRGQDTFRGADRFPVEGTVRDADGAELDVVLYVADGRIYELELIKIEGGSALSPDWTSFTLK